VTNTNSAVLPELNWASRMGASRLPSVSVPGTSVPAAGPFTALLPVPAVHALPRVRGKVAVAATSAPQDAVTAPLGQTNTHNYMTSVSATGEGASGPPRDSEPV
jgi:hypothetical protein